jgi:hypothetical protein
MADEVEEVITTDQAIMDSIGEGNEPTASESTDGEATGTEENTEEATPSASSEQGTEQSSETEQQHTSSGPQDLRDAQGNVVAAGGKERRFYETAQHSMVYHQKKSQQVHKSLLHGKKTPSAQSNIC